MHFRYGVSGVLKTRQDAQGLLLGGTAAGGGHFRGVGENGRGPGDALLQQQVGGFEERIGVEPPLHGLIQQHVVQGQEAHALVMGHE